MDDNPDQTINSYRDTILSHSGEKILNLSGFSNTELKLKYGASNIQSLSDYDNNHTLIIAILHKWADRLYSQNYYKEAMAVLEVALDCDTDVHKSFELLAIIYNLQGYSGKISILLDRISSSNIRDKDNLLVKIQEQLKA